MDLSKRLRRGAHGEVFPWQEGKIVKLSRIPGPVAWVEYEFRLAKLVHASGLSVPEPFEMVEVEGRRGIVYARVEGKSTWAGMRAAPYKLLYFGRMLGRLHAEIHAHLAPPGLPDLHDFLCGQIQTLEDVPPEVLRSMVEKLDGLPRGDRLLHFDFHPGNVLLTSAGPMIIDWFSVARGDPLADVAHTWFLISGGRRRRNPVVYVVMGALQRAYLKAYFEKSPCRRADLEPWLAFLRIFLPARRRTIIRRGLHPPGPTPSCGSTN